MQTKRTAEYHALRRFAILLSLIALFAPTAFGRSSDQAESTLKGEHRLKRVTEAADGLSVKLSWEISDNVYVFSFLPLEKVRVRIVEEIDAPTIKFAWKPCNRTECQNDGTMRHLMEHVTHATITVDESDFLPNITLPLDEP